MRLPERREKVDHFHEMVGLLHLPRIRERLPPLSLSLLPVLIINLFARRGDNLFGVELAFNRFVPSLRSSFLKCILSETTRGGSRSLLTEQIYRGRVFRWWPRFRRGGKGRGTQGYLGFNGDACAYANS